jgi:hypothetical protein
MSSVIEEAAGILAERAAAYGNPIPNHERIAAFWTVKFRRKLKDGEVVTASDVAQCMRLVKESRLIETPGHRDSLVDICGYADCENVIAEASHAGAHSSQDVGCVVCPEKRPAEDCGRDVQRAGQAGQVNHGCRVSDR